MVAVVPEPAARGGIHVKVVEVHDAVVFANRLDDRERVEHAFERRAEPDRNRSAATTSWACTSRRVASGRRTLLVVVVVDPADAHAVVIETWADVPGVPILIVSDSSQPFVPSESVPSGWVDTVRSSQPVQDLCWLVLEAISRASHVPGIDEHPLGPHRIEVDEREIVCTASLTPDVAIATFMSLRPGDSLSSLVDPLEQSTITIAIERVHAGVTHFCAVRLVDGHGHRHIMAFGIRCIGEGRVAAVAQPLISGGPIVGRGEWRGPRSRDPAGGGGLRRGPGTVRRPASAPGLAAAGVEVALDDFGSGTCRLQYLTQWPLAIVRLDQLVAGYVDDDPLQREFLRTVVSLCRARGITTVAEYTRTAEQLDRLVEDGIDLLQGELFSMPRPAAEVLASYAAAGAWRAGAFADGRGPRNALPSPAKQVRSPVRGAAEEETDDRCLPVENA